jgi:cytoskeletal protein CcmA (bactofilin family)
MFKKSDDQDWSRFRGGLSKERDDAATAAAGETTTSAQGPAGSATASPGSAGFRPVAGDTHVGQAAGQVSRGVHADGAEVESLIGERTHFEGTLKCEGAIRLQGTVQGEIQSAGTIIVEDRAHVTARLTGAQVTIAGQVDGQIYCEGRVEIRPTGRVTGEISAGALIIHEGAYFDGNSRMAASAAGASSGRGAASGSGVANASGAASAGSARAAPPVASGTPSDAAAHRASA